MKIKRVREVNNQIEDELSQLQKKFFLLLNQHLEKAYWATINSHRILYMFSGWFLCTGWNPAILYMVLIPLAPFLQHVKGGPVSEFIKKTRDVNKSIIWKFFHDGENENDMICELCPNGKIIRHNKSTFNLRRQPFNPTFLTCLVKGTLNRHARAPTLNVRFELWKKSEKNKD